MVTRSIKALLAAIFFSALSIPASAQWYGVGASPSSNVIPAPNGVFVGAAVGAAAQGIGTCSTIPGCTANFETAVGRKMALHVEYFGFTDLANITTDSRTVDDWNNGVNPRIPLIKWSCSEFVSGTTYNHFIFQQIARGEFDSQIIAAAQGVKAYGHPIMLEMPWEWNDNWLMPGGDPNHNNCFAQAGNGNAITGAEYTQAYRHIVNIFRQQGVNNVAWLWNPDTEYSVSGTGRSIAGWPGAGYVDWVACDAYDQQDVGLVVSMSLCYSLMTQYNKPIVVAETGTTNGQAAPWTQVRFWQDALSNIGPGTQYPMIRGFCYFDNSVWYLDTPGGGLAAMAATISSPMWNPPIP